MTATSPQWPLSSVPKVAIYLWQGLTVILILPMIIKRCILSYINHIIIIKEKDEFFHLFILAFNKINDFDFLGYNQL